MLVSPMLRPESGHPACLRNCSTTYRQTEGAVVALPDVLVQEPLGFEHDLLVIVKLVAPDAHSGLENGAGVVVPLETGVWLVPVHAPAEIAGVDVTGETLLVAMQLVADEVHLSRQSGLVALEAQVVCICEHVAADLSGVVVGADGHGQLARDHAHARGGTKW